MLDHALLIPCTSFRLRDSSICGLRTEVVILEQSVDGLNLSRSGDPALG